MNRPAWWIMGLPLLVWPPTPVYGLCGGPLSFCERLPNLADRNSAIFVGTVVQIRGTVVRFKIAENFLNAESAELQLAVTSDLYVDDVPVQVPSFALGAQWLAEAQRQNENQRWTTSHCSRTKALESAAQDLSVLRAWRSGQQFPASASGEVWDPEKRKNIPGIRIDLISDSQTLSTTSDKEGQFLFEGLANGKYEVVARLPTGEVRRDLDLKHAWCARIVFTVN